MCIGKLAKAGLRSRGEYWKKGRNVVAVCHARIPAVQQISRCSNSYSLILHRLLISSRCL